MGFIYMITGPGSTNKSYIGKTQRTLQRRFIEHACMAGCPKIHAAIKDFGKEAFKEECLIQIDDELLDEYEQKFIQQYETEYPRGYNLSSGGSKGTKWHSSVVESRKRFGEDHHLYGDNRWKGKKHTPQTREKMSASMKEVYTEERRDLVVERNMQRKSNDLPKYISYKRDDAGVIVGYQVQSKKKLFPFKSFADRSLSMEVKLQQAQDYLAAHMVT